jgi:hypothetical protein
MPVSAASPIEGGCQCGEVRYRLVAEPLACYVCHCTDCQRRTGSAFSTALIVPTEGLEVTTGTPSPYFASLSGGRIKSGQQCTKCSTRLWGTLQQAPGIRVLQPGTLDEPRRFPPVAHVWTRSALPWVVIPSHVATYEENAPFAEVAALWQRSRDLQAPNVS